MKKIVSLALVCMLILTLFVGCGGASDPAGKYVLKTINGMSAKEYLEDQVGGSASGVSLEDAAAILGFDVNKLDELVTFELSKDGKAHVSAFMLDEAMDGEWKLEGSKLTITIEGSPAEFEYKNGEITGDMGNDTSIVLVRSK